jgi:hypothetical protein
MDKQLIAVSASFFCGRTVDNYASTSIASTSAEVRAHGLTNQTRFFGNRYEIGWKQGLRNESIPPLSDSLPSGIE